jgi:hypothetical protein
MTLTATQPSANQFAIISDYVHFPLLYILKHCYNTIMLLMFRQFLGYYFIFYQFFENSYYMTYFNTIESIFNCSQLILLYQLKHYCDTYL